MPFDGKVFIIFIRLSLKLNMEDELLKFICFFEYEGEDIDKILPLFEKMVGLRGKPGYPKAIMPSQHFAGETNGFTIYEADDPQQMINHFTNYEPYMRFTWKPLVETTEVAAAHRNKGK